MFHHLNIQLTFLFPYANPLLCFSDEVIKGKKDATYQLPFERTQ